MFDSYVEMESSKNSMFLNIVFAIILLFMPISICWIGIAALNNYVQDPDAVKVLRESGYTGISLGPTSMWLCPANGEIGTPFSAISEKNHFVRGVVCYTGLSGHQIRID